MKRLKLIPPLLILLFFASCDKISEKKENAQEIIVNIESDPIKLDPRKATLITDYNIIKTFSDGLFRANHLGETTPALVENYSVSSDKIKYEFELKKTFWSNGDPLTAHDFIYAWKCSLSPDFPSQCAHLLYPIKNAKNIKEGNLPISMIGAYAKDDYTLVVELEKPTPYFLDLTKNVIYFPVNETYDKNHSNIFANADTIISNGPFNIKSWKNNNEIVLEKNPYYWESDRVKLSKVTMIMVDSDTAFRMYEQGDLHWIGAPNSNLPIDSIVSLKNDDKVNKTPLIATYWIRVNTNKPNLQDVKMRKSLAYSINRTEICKHILHGEGNPATGIVPELLGLQEKPYFIDGDTETAKALFKQTGVKKNLNLRLSFASNSKQQVIAQAIQDQWKKALDIDVVLEPLEAKVFYSNIAKGDYDLACGRWVADYKDPVTFLDVYKTRDSGVNQTGWENVSYIKALNESFNQVNENRIALLKESEKVLIDEMPVIPVYNFMMLHLKDEKLKDVVLTDMSHIDFKYAYIEH
ncbi:MAG: Oligopeptide-binding protein OppA [Chlamydiia bacterium]|nr:Oligopeptide-binding protein OppA [Chlamydiia bacterium]